MLIRGNPFYWMKFRVWLGAKLYGYLRSSTVCYVGPRKILKVRCHRTELEAMEYVRKHTTIPIPKVYKAYDKGDYQNLLMERVPGQDLAAAWESLTAAQKTNIV